MSVIKECCFLTLDYSYYEMLNPFWTSEDSLSLTLNGYEIISECVARNAEFAGPAGCAVSVPPKKKKKQTCVKIIIFPILCITIARSRKKNANYAIFFLRDLHLHILSHNNEYPWREVQIPRQKLSGFQLAHRENYT